MYYTAEADKRSPSLFHAKIFIPLLLLSLVLVAIGAYYSFKTNKKTKRLYAIENLSFVPHELPDANPEVLPDQPQQTAPEIQLLYKKPGYITVEDTKVNNDTVVQTTKIKQDQTNYILITTYIAKDSKPVELTEEPILLMLDQGNDALKLVTSSDGDKRELTYGTYEPNLQNPDSFGSYRTTFPLMSSENPYTFEVKLYYTNPESIEPLEEVVKSIRAL